jgi:hypothetical protein
MYHIPAYETAVTLFSRDGDVWAYPSLRAALTALGRDWIARNVGPHFRVFRCNSRVFDTARETWVAEPVYDEHAFIMRDDAGEPVTLAAFYPLIERRRYQSRWTRMLDTWNGEGPVPGVHKRSAGRHYFRRPQTMNERRQACLVLLEEGEVAPRAARNVSHLPNSWDDCCVASRENRNWKQFRKTRWSA